MSINSEKERLLCYSAGILGSTLSNPNNKYQPKDLIKYSIRAAYQMINTIYDDKLLKEIIDEKTP